MKEYTRVLTIAGSDSGGGAGIQADLKTIAACGCYGMSAITAVTVQNTKGVAAIHPVPAPVVEAQIRTVLDDIGAGAIKIGMLYSKEVVEQVGMTLAGYPGIPIILDPVLTATSGDPLVCCEITEAMRTGLLPLVRLLTPNVPEAENLLGCPIGNDLASAATALAGKFSVSVLVKAGHLKGTQLTDMLYDFETGTLSAFEHPRVQTANTHGTGCTLSAAIAAFVAQGLPLPVAVRRAQDYLRHAIAVGSLYRLGQGHGPVHHFHAFWR